MQLYLIVPLRNRVVYVVCLQGQFFFIAYVTKNHVSSTVNVFNVFCSSAIFNEQQAGNSDVAVSSLHSLLLRHVYSAYLGVSSSHCKTASMRWIVNPPLMLKYVLFFCISDLMQQLTSIREPC